MIYIGGAPIGGEDQRERAWRDAVAAACRGWEGGPALSLAFSVRRTRRLDLDNLVRPAVAGLRDAGVYRHGLRTLHCVTADREWVEGDGGLRISAGRPELPGEVAWEARHTLPPSGATGEWIGGWAQVVGRATVAADPACEVFVDIEVAAPRRSLVELLKPVVDGLEPWLGRDPAGRAVWCPNDHRVRWLRVARVADGPGLTVRAGVVAAGER